MRLLAENAGKLLTKDALIERVREGRIVSETAISSRINAARRAVGDSGKAQAVIRTVPRRGFEFVALPTLVIHARKCSLHPLEEGRILAAGITGAQFLVVDSANVAAVLSDPTFDEQNRAILDFLAAGHVGNAQGVRGER